MISRQTYAAPYSPPCHQGGGDLPKGDLRTLIEGQYGSLDTLQTTLTNTTVGVQGSGWGWLGYDKVSASNPP